MSLAFSHALRVALLCFAFCVAGPRLRASTPDTSYTLNLPVQADQATPVWLGHPLASTGTFASLDLPVTAPEINESLLVTIVFEEKPGGFLRLTWKNAEGEQLLSGNFYEGVGMANKRTLLIPSSIVQDMGTLSIQTGQATLDVSQIRFEWLEGGVALVSSEQTDQTVVPRLGATMKAETLDGQPAGVPVADIDGNLITVPITNSPQHIEQGVEFSLQLAGTPKAARLTLQESGLPWGRHLVIWVNQQRAGTASPVVPDLEEAGYASPPDAAKPFIGWRDVSVYLPVTLMKTGLNTLQISTEADNAPADGTTDDDTGASQQPLAVNNLACQFDYTAATPTLPSLTEGPVSASSANTKTEVTPVETASAVPPSPSSDLPSSATPTGPVSASSGLPADTAAQPALPDYQNSTVP